MVKEPKSEESAGIDLTSDEDSLSPADEDTLLFRLLAESNSPEVADFIAAWNRQRREKKPPLPTTATGVRRRAQLIADTLDPESRISAELRLSCSTLYRRTGDILSPYLEIDDIVSIVREKLWGLPDSQLRAAELPPIFRTIARNAIIDQIRRFKPRSTIPWSETHELATAEDSQNDTARLWRNLETAFRKAGAEYPEWLMEPVRAYLLEDTDSTSALTAINQARADANLPTWSPAAFRQFLHRFRKKLRNVFEP